ncbi:MAG: hypothetical protein PHF23_08725, partial [Smithellaceae bacterium]|nr:hypothetical protein [Smithellaceae bacterium]
ISVPTLEDISFEKPYLTRVSRRATIYRFQFFYKNRAMNIQALRHRQRAFYKNIGTLILNINVCNNS